MLHYPARKNKWELGEGWSIIQEGSNKKFTLISVVELLFCLKVFRKGHCQWTKFESFFGAISDVIIFFGNFTVWLITVFHQFIITMINN